MKEDEARSRLLEETRRALARHASLRAEVDEGDAREPEPGDVFVLERTADYDVEWAILARDPSDSRRLLTVPADGCSLVGSSDVEIPDEAPFGPLVLRCRFGRWIDAKHFDPGSRVAVLGPDDLARARHKCSEVEAGDAAAHEADLDPDYRDWVEGVLVPAQLALAGPLT